MRISIWDPASIFQAFKPRKGIVLILCLLNLFINISNLFNAILSQFKFIYVQNIVYMQFKQVYSSVYCISKTFYYERKICYACIQTNTKLFIVLRSIMQNKIKYHPFL